MISDSQKIKGLPGSVKDQLICDIVDAVSWKEDGTPTLKWGTDEKGVSHGGLMAYSKNLWLLYSMDDFVASKLNRLRFSLSKGDIFGAECLGVFAKLKTENRKSFSDFEEEFNAKVEQHIKNLPITKFTVAFALNFDIKEKLNFKIDVHRFRIIPYDDFKQEFIDFETEIQKAADKLAKHSMKEWKELSEGFSFFVIDVFSRNHLFAQSCASKILQCLLGLLVFSKKIASGDRYTVPVRPQSKLILSTFFTFEGGKRLGPQSYLKERPSHEKIDEYDLLNLGVSLDLFNEIRYKAMKDMIFDALITYYWASVDEDVEDSAFKYWICIEQLLLQSRHTAGAELVERIKSLPVWGENRYLEFEIENLYEKRNRYAHEYGAGFHQIERNLAKAIADELIRLLLSENQSFFKKRDLLKFYELIQKDSDGLENKLRDDRQALDDNQRIAHLILRLRE